MKVVTNAMLYDCYPRLKLWTLKRLACFPQPSMSMLLQYDVERAIEWLGATLRRQHAQMVLL